MKYLETKFKMLFGEVRLDARLKVGSAVSQESLLPSPQLLPRGFGAIFGAAKPPKPPTRRCPKRTQEKLAPTAAAAARGLFSKVPA